MLIDKVLVYEALEMARPTAEAIIHTPGANWGPTWVEVRIMAPGLKEPLKFLFGRKTDWNHEWGLIKDFNAIADRKLTVVERERASTSVIVFAAPWLLEDGELLYSGGAHRDGISVACSGIKGRADEKISEIIISCIKLLALLEADRRRESKDFAQEQMYTVCMACRGSGKITVMGLDSVCSNCGGSGRQ